MKKKTFVNLLLGVVGGLLFSVGLCMCLLPQWNAFTAGVVITAAGAVVLLALLIANRKKREKKVNWKTVGKVVYGIIAALIMGVGMCMVLVWELLLPGIAVGIAGIVMLLFLIPMCVGLK